jgi:Bacterial capsule synthesis protein PGA_cap
MTAVSLAPWRAPLVAATTRNGAAVASIPDTATAERLDRPLRHAILEFSGDELAHDSILQQALRNGGGLDYDFGPMFSRVKPILSAADLAVCHLETPVAPPGEPLTTWPIWGIPAQISVGLAFAGFDRCSTASNHSIDRGVAGIDATVSALEAAGLSEAGMARNPAEATATLVDANGITVAHLAYTFGLNGGHLPADQPWRANLIDVPTIIAAARDARTRGADIVVLNLHWGDQFVGAVSAYQRNIADALTSSGEIDLIVGEHVHLIQPIAMVNGVWVVFGMGNFFSNQSDDDLHPPDVEDGMIVSVNVTERSDGSYAVDRPGVIPTWVDRAGGFVIRPILSDLADPDVTTTTKQSLQASLQRTTAVVGEFIVG